MNDRLIWAIENEKKYKSEQWRDIPGFAGYQASNMGRIRTTTRIVERISSRSGNRLRVNGRILRRLSETNPKKYPCFLINGKQRSAHRLVALTWVPGWFEGAEVNHKDHNRHNNHPDNLEWVTHAQNMKHARLAKRIGKPNAKLTQEKVKQIRFLLLDGNKESNVASLFGVDTSLINRIKNNKIWKE